MPPPPRPEITKLLRSQQEPRTPHAMTRSPMRYTLLSGSDCAFEDSSDEETRPRSSTSRHTSVVPIAGDVRPVRFDDKLGSVYHRSSAATSGFPKTNAPKAERKPSLLSQAPLNAQTHPAPPRREQQAPAMLPTASGPREPSRASPGRPSPLSRSAPFTQSPASSPKLAPRAWYEKLHAGGTASSGKRGGRFDDHPAVDPGSRPVRNNTLLASDRIPRGGYWPREPTATELNQGRLKGSREGALQPPNLPWDAATSNKRYATF